MKLIELKQLTERLLKKFPEDTEIVYRETDGKHGAIDYSTVYEDKLVLAEEWF